MAMVVILDYGAGNLTSMRLAFEDLGAEVEISDRADRIRRADRVVFPGVGAAGAAMQRLKSSGLDRVVKEIVASGTPFLGVCLGMQIAFEYSEEDGGVDLLGLLPGRVKRFRPVDRAAKVPHMGWNSVRQMSKHFLFGGIEDESEFYFVHSYYVDPGDPSCILGQTDYAGVIFASAVARRNLVATQFHPEKSGRVGLRMLLNFLKWQGE
ncbi:MAG: imidazole glycerol phosphate synthase subunit HisH [Kiritimatiellae bacterium]|nr:imidazole glycerol phosphate synthase subunit HisH [Kiritimatiellia bacterium]